MLLLSVTGAPRAEEQPAEDLPGAAPFLNALRSLAFPGWGQLHAGNRWKAVALFAGQTYLLGRVAITERRARWYDDQRSRADSPWSDAYLEERYEDLRQTRRDLVWWSTIAALYSVLDAYVDAHLVGFDEAVDEVDRVTWTVGPAPGGGARIALRAVY
ncbi:MAG: hypothetical protein JW958_10765 [Candidatus Eisenbacteria bacterium]|nr:hypothetical protein [Candidatus Eisenbacteria bacterium]